MRDDGPTGTPADRYMTVPMLAEAYPAFPEASLRWLLFKRASNGLEAAVIRIGRRLLISEAGWRAWLEGNREANPTVPKATPTKGRRTRKTAAA